MTYKLLTERFKENADAGRAAEMAAYMRDKFKFYGIQTPQRKALYKDILKDSKRAGELDWALLDICYGDEHREFQYFVMDYLQNMQKFLTFEDIPKIKKYVKAKQWWDTIDGFDRLIGNINFPDERVDKVMLEWSTDEDFWLRRIAIDHQLLRKDNTNTELLEKILCNNFGSDEFFINKAIGWALRDYSKTNPGWVRDFIGKYSGQMSKLSLKEAGKYI